jgi:L-ascorbate metabolism protein UlaG (beta-lactamase superfamily)
MGIVAISECAAARLTRWAAASSRFGCTMKGECDGVGYLVRGGRKTIYHAGDTDIIAEMSSLGKVKLALFPIGGIYSMDMDEAVEAVSVIKPEHVLPMHHLKADVQAF